VPELPEVETVKRGLNQVTRGQVIMGGAVFLERTIASPASVAEFWQGITGCVILSWQRRGKYLLGELARPAAVPLTVPLPAQSTVLPVSHSLHAYSHRAASSQAPWPQQAPWPPKEGEAGATIAAGWLGVHLRMTGQLLWVPREAPLLTHTRVCFHFASGQDLRFVDSRTFGRVWWVSPDRPPESCITGLQALGPEPFSSDFSAAYLQDQFRGRQRPIKSALLDQTLLAGVGNIYADEALFISGIHPTTPCARLQPDQIQRLQQAILAVLEASIQAGGTTISDFRSVAGVNGNYGGEAKVYGRTGQDCRVCGTPIQRIRLAGRSSHFCPVCQR